MWKALIYFRQTFTERMAAADSLDVTLVPVDTSILSCWEEKVKQGLDCSLLLRHSKGKVITTLKCSGNREDKGHSGRDKPVLLLWL